MQKNHSNSLPIADGTAIDTKTLSDEKLLNLCQQYGEQARKWRQKFIGLLPEVYKRQLHEKRGFGSIFEFAKKLAGLSEDQVSRALNIEKKLTEKGAFVIKQRFENGEISINKLARVASVVNAENQDFWAAQVKLLSKRALDTLIKDEKYLADEQKAGFSNLNNTALFVPVHKSDRKNEAWQYPDKQELVFSTEVKQKLLELQRKGIDINALILDFLKKREEEIVQEKEKLSQEAKYTNSRYIPKAVRQNLQKEFGTKCSIEWCMREAAEIHHSQRFRLGRKHDPKYLAPFCEEHHAIAHSIDQKTASYVRPL